MFRYEGLPLGSSPLDHEERSRIEYAKSLLDTTRLAPDDVAARVGYERCGTFFRIFKGRTGQTPKAYRDRFGGA